jgi:hypothetical protein
VIPAVLPLSVLKLGACAIAGEVSCRLNGRHRVFRVRARRAGSRHPPGDNCKHSALQRGRNPDALPSIAEAEGVKAWQNRCRVLSVQEAAERLAIVVLGLLGNAGIRYPIEAVIRPGYM